MKNEESKNVERNIKGGKMKKNLLKSKMSLHEDNNKTLAHKLKITPSAFSRKINGSSNFTIEEMKFIRKEYGLSDIEFLDIFFNN